MECVAIDCVGEERKHLFDSENATISEWNK